MTLVPPLPEHAGRSIAQFLESHTESSGASGVVVGLSGGIDSALTLHLARDALGGRRVTGVLLPDQNFPSPLEEEIGSFARHLGVGTVRIPTDTIESAYRETMPDLGDRVAWGNTRARIRMSLLYAAGRQRKALVVGTGNKSELLLGYFTKHGDGGVDLLPIGDLYKTQERQLAAELGLPRSFLDRTPTAGFWEGQTDEGELGAPYSQIDEVLAGLEQLRTPAEIAKATRLRPALVRAIVARVEANRHKRRPPPIPKLGLRTIGLDWKD